MDSSQELPGHGSEDREGRPQLGPVQNGEYHGGGEGSRWEAELSGVREE